MALIKCDECGRPMSDRAAACPQCGAPAGASKTPKPLTPPIPVQSVGVPLWQKVVGSLLAVAAVVSCIKRAGKPPAEHAFDAADALYLCGQAFRLVSKDPERAEVPYVEGFSSGDEISFSWGHATKMLRLRNGLGLEVAASGSCAVSKTQKRVVSLTLNGETII